MAEPKDKQQDAMEKPPAPPARKPLNLRVRVTETEIHVAGDQEALAALGMACNTAIRRWKEDASTMLLAAQGKGKPSLPVFIIGLVQ